MIFHLFLMRCYPLPGRPTPRAAGAMAAPASSRVGQPAPTALCAPAASAVRAPRKEGARHRRGRRPRAEARVRALLVRDAGLLAAHRGGPVPRPAATPVAAHEVPSDPDPELDLPVPASEVRTFMIDHASEGCVDVCMGDCVNVCMGDEEGLTHSRACRTWRALVKALLRPRRAERRIDPEDGRARSWTALLVDFHYWATMQPVDGTALVLLWSLAPRATLSSSSLTRTEVTQALSPAGLETGRLSCAAPRQCLPSRPARLSGGSRPPAGSSPPAARTDGHDR